MHVVGNLVAGKDPAGALGQHVQDAELGGGQIDGPLIDKDFVPAGMDDYVLNSDGGIIIDDIADVLRRSWREFGPKARGG